VGRRGDNNPATPRIPSGFSSNTPTDTVINQRIQSFGEVPGTIARKFYDKERNVSPERKAGMPTPGGSRVKALSLKEQSNLIDKLQKENWKLKLKLYFMDQTIAERSDESVKAMISENVELKTLKFSNTKEIRNLKRTIRELEYKIKERDEALAKERENQRNASFSEQSQDLENEVSYLRERVESYEIEIDKLRTDNATKEGEKRRLAEMVNMSGDRSRVGSDGGSREGVQMWKELLETETARKEQADEENRKLREENWRLKAQAAGAAPSTRSESSRAINGDSMSESTLVEQLRHENAELRREVGAQTSMLTSRNREKERLYQEIEDLKMGQRRGDGRSDILDRSISRAHGRSSSRTSSQTRVTQLGDAEREMYESRNGQLRDEISRLKLENQQLAEEMEKLLDELDAIGNTREELDQLQKRFDDLTEDTNQEILAMQRERDEALQGQERVETDFQDLKAEAQERIDRLEDELDQNGETIKQLEEELGTRDEETKMLRNEVRMTSEGLDKVEADVQQKVRRIKELELEIEEITAELEGIEKSSIEVNAKNDKLLVELESRQNECAFLREEQDGYVLKHSELENAMKTAQTGLTSEKDKVKDLERRLAEERHQREVIGGKKEQEQQRIMNELNREASEAKDETRKIRKVIETRDVEVRTWKERHFELETTIREVIGDPNGTKASFATVGVSQQAVNAQANITVYCQTPTRIGTIGRGPRQHSQSAYRARSLTSAA
jgi:predicted  nucleic acid-binding Zn-ribbon protein